MTFSEKLNKKIEREASKRFKCSKPCDSFGVCDGCADAFLYRVGAKDIAPLLVEAYEALLQAQEVLEIEEGLVCLQAKETLTRLEKFVDTQRKLLTD